jgi:hypothetical protein
MKFKSIKIKPHGFAYCLQPIIYSRKSQVIWIASLVKLDLSHLFEALVVVTND